jgi:hypothetical protein
MQRSHARGCTLHISWYGFLLTSRSLLIFQSLGHANSRSEDLLITTAECDLAIQAKEYANCIGASELAGEWGKCSYLRKENSKCTFLVVCLAGMTDSLASQGSDVDGLARYFAPQTIITWVDSRSQIQSRQLPDNMDMVVLTVEVRKWFSFTLATF